jgi:hypothetical protein
MKQLSYTLGLVLTRRRAQASFKSRFAGAKTEGRNFIMKNRPDYEKQTRRSNGVTSSRGEDIGTMARIAAVDE